MPYDKLLLATGAKVREAHWIKGIEKAKHVYYLRDAYDQERIKAVAETVKDGVAILGSSFNGSEAAASLKGRFKKNFDIHLIGLEEYPIETVFGKEIGKLMFTEHKKRGIIQHMQKGIEEIIVDDSGEIQEMILTDGTRHKISMLICGVGVTPCTGYLQNSETGINIEKSGAIICDSQLQTSVTDIYAAGDIASYPFDDADNHNRIEHWNTAMDQGSYVAFNMLGKEQKYKKTPYFWTKHYNFMI